MTEYMGEWPSGYDQLTKIGLSYGRGGETIITRCNLGTIAMNLKVIWEMSAKYIQMISAKFEYLFRSGARRLVCGPYTCTNCGSRDHTTVDRKYVVTELRRCNVCNLMFRVPTDSEKDSQSFYQNAYRQGFTTDLPTDAELDGLLRTDFANTEKDYDYYLSVLRKIGLGKGMRLFDFGCSWGYGSWQFAKAGYQVKSFEISKPRAEFATKKLNVDCLPEISYRTFRGKLANTFDCFFSAHVLEHVPSPAKVIELASMALKPGGWFIAFTPNGSEQFQRIDPKAWRMLWGKVHPNFLDEKYYETAFKGKRHFIASSPVDGASVERFVASGGPSAVGNLEGPELFCMARL